MRLMTRLQVDLPSLLPVGWLQGVLGVFLMPLSVFLGLRRAISGVFLDVPAWGDVCCFQFAIGEINI